MSITLDERKELRRLLDKYPDLSLTKIAERLKRSKNSIVTEVRINGGREGYDAAKADERAVRVQKEGRESMMIKNRKAVLDLETKYSHRHLQQELNLQKMEIQKLREQLEFCTAHQSHQNYLSFIKRLKTLENKVKKLKNPL